MMQFNMYHHYTVDEHLIRAVGAHCQNRERQAWPRASVVSEILPSIKDRQVLYVTLLIHDIAKGRIEDHSIAGARIARAIVPAARNEREPDRACLLSCRNI
ncbi:MAG: HD domain-containing protein [Nitratireductor sp.]